MSAIIRYFAALHAHQSVPHYLKQCRGIVTKMTGNPSFPSPTIDLVQVSKDIDALDLAEQAAHQGPKGAIADRDIKLLVVRSDMRQLKEYVQGRADADLGNAVAIIEGAGYFVVSWRGPGKPDFAAKYTKTPGALLLAVEARKPPVSYYWQMCASPTSPSPANRIGRGP